MRIELIPLFTYFNRKLVEEDKSYIYLFTDNSKRTSGNIPIEDGWYKNKYGKNKTLNRPTTTQAIIRGLDNAYPITTVVDNKRTQWSNSMFEEYKIIIDDEINQIIHALKTGKYRGIKYSSIMPFGKGQISNMKETSPLCWNYLNEKLLKLKINQVPER